MSGPAYGRRQAARRWLKIIWVDAFLPMVEVQTRVFVAFWPVIVEAIHEVVPLQAIVGQGPCPDAQVGNASRHFELVSGRQNIPLMLELARDIRCDTEITDKLFGFIEDTGDRYRNRHLGAIARNIGPVMRFRAEAFGFEHQGIKSAHPLVKVVPNFVCVPVDFGLAVKHQWAQLPDHITGFVGQKSFGTTVKYGYQAV